MARKRRVPQNGIDGSFAGDDPRLDTSPGASDVTGDETVARPGTRTGSGAETGTEAGAGTGAGTEAVAEALDTGQPVIQVDQPTDDEQRRAMQARRARERRARIKAEEKAKEDQTRSAETVVGVLNAVAAVSVGEWAVMTPDEQAAVTPPLARILTRLTDEQRAALDRYADPIALLGALGLWGWRVYQEAQARQPKPELVIDRTEVQPESPTPVMDLSLDEYRYRGTT